MNRMIRTAITYALIVTLWACPLRCLVDSLLIQPTSSTAVRHCACCSLPAGSDAESAAGSQSLPTDRDSAPGETGSCLCDGAILDTLSVLPDFSLEQVDSLPGCLAMVPESNVARRLRLAGMHHERCVNSAGRSARIAHQSWLL
ncbi:hypothetical protein [Aureliella helgolandensis]|nr:hypothetical protein [Aureliella helgolandensis]